MKDSFCTMIVASDGLEGGDAVLETEEENVKIKGGEEEEGEGEGEEEDEDEGDEIKDGIEELTDGIFRDDRGGG